MLSDKSSHSSDSHIATHLPLTYREHIRKWNQSADRQRLDILDCRLRQPSCRTVCGESLFAASCPNASHQSDINAALSQVIAHSAKWLDGGAYSTDIVVEAVRALEDCSLFNAGKGSALTRNGTCEVNFNIIQLSNLH